MTYISIAQSKGVALLISVVIRVLLEGVDLIPENKARISRNKQ
jgi:hypothetical protein